MIISKRSSLKLRRQSPKIVRLDLNNPPTAVVGIPAEAGFARCRLDLNDPQLPLWVFRLENESVGIEVFLTLVAPSLLRHF